MKTKDQVLLEEAYLKVASQKEVIEEKGLKSLAAGAALGLATLTGLHAGDKGMTADDQADRSMIAQTNSPEMTTLAKAQDAYERLLDMIDSKEKYASQEKDVLQELFKAIAADKSLAARCAQAMVLRGFELPDILRKVVGDVDKVMKSSLMGP